MVSACHYCHGPGSHISAAVLIYETCTSPAMVRLRGGAPRAKRLVDWRAAWTLKNNPLSWAPCGNAE
jgi:hypothetical protein